MCKLLNIGEFYELTPVFRNVFLAPTEVVAKEYVKHLLGLFYIGWHYFNQSPGSRRHCCETHHISVIFAKPLGSLNGKFLFTDFVENF